MPKINNGLNQAPGARWRKSTYSGDPSIGTCVEMTRLPGAGDGQVIGIRDTKQRGTGSVLAVPGTAMQALFNQIKSGQLL